MSVKTVLGMALGLAIFFSGIALLKASLTRFEPFIGPLLRQSLNRPFWGVLVGFITAALIQSSSATNAIAVGFVAAGIIGLPHAFSIVLGSNIGTTVTPQIAAYGTLDAGFAFLTIALLLQLIKRETVQQMGMVLAGIGAIFVGLWVFGGATAQFTDTILGERLVEHISARKEGAVLYGALLTAVVQSSSVVSSLLVSLADHEIVATPIAVAGVLGSNIGTVSTTIIVALSGGMVARRTAWADLLFNVLGVILIWPFFDAFLAVVGQMSYVPGRQVAHAHTLFNVVTVLIMIPFIQPFCRLITRMTGSKKER